MVDDISTKYLEQYESIKKSSINKNVIFLENSAENKGAGGARNLGIKHATGKKILFADSDDFYVDDFYEVLTPFLTKTYDVVFFFADSINLSDNTPSKRHGRINRILHNHLNFETRESLLELKYNFTAPWCKLIDKELLKTNNICFDLTQKANDIMFSMRVGHYMKSFYVCDSLLYVITDGGDNITKLMTQKAMQDKLSVAIESFQFLKQNLSIKDFKYLTNTKDSISSKWALIINTIKYGDNQFTIFTLRNLRKNQMKWFDTRLINPFYTIPRIPFHIKSFIKNRS